MDRVAGSVQFSNNYTYVSCVLMIGFKIKRFERTRKMRSSVKQSLRMLYAVTLGQVCVFVKQSQKTATFGKVEHCRTMDNSQGAAKIL